ncbi:MAG: hypothetical protein JSU06_13015 [Actinobacteria bacterium]|nr:hypothetical protein [Actinomycetota bacterium]
MGGFLAAVGIGGTAISAVGAAPVQAKPTPAVTQKADAETVDGANAQKGDAETADGGHGKADTETADGAGSEAGSEVPGNDGPGGHADEPGNPNAEHEAGGQTE